MPDIFTGSAGLNGGVGQGGTAGGAQSELRTASELTAALDLVVNGGAGGAAGDAIAKTDLDGQPGYVGGAGGLSSAVVSDGSTAHSIVVRANGGIGGTGSAGTEGSIGTDHIGYGAAGGTGGAGGAADAHITDASLTFSGTADLSSFTLSATAQGGAGGRGGEGGDGALTDEFGFPQAGAGGSGGVGGNANATVDANIVSLSSAALLVKVWATAGNGGTNGYWGSTLYYPDEEYVFGGGFGQAVAQITANEITGGDGVELVTLQIGGTHAVDGSIPFGPEPPAEFADVTLSANIVDLGAGDDKIVIKAETGESSLFSFKDNVFSGGAGNDTLVLSGIEYIDQYTDTPKPIVFNLRNNMVTGFERIEGGWGEESIVADDSGMTIYALGGDDTVLGGTGDDYLDGGDGWDRLEGGLGNDTYVSEDTGETIVEAANAGTDTIIALADYALAANFENLTLGGSGDLNGSGNAGANVLTGNDGVNILAGGGGDDTYVIGEGDIVNESANEGTDEVRVSAAAFTLSANVENMKGTAAGGQALTGNGGNNIIEAADGNDTIDGGAGSDAMRGQSGDDVYHVDSSGDQVFEDDGEGADKVFASVSFTMAGQALETLTLLGSSHIDGTGNGLDNHISGNVGDNRLTGGGGNDVLDGGLGNDVMDGGTGNDAYEVDDLGDEVTELGDAGTDRVLSALDAYTLGANVENLRGMLDSGQVLTGNDLNNDICGGNGGDTLDGMGGNDRLRGRGGDDVYYVDGKDDKVTETADNGFDSVYAAATFSIVGQHVEHLTLLGSGDFNATGNGLDNMLAGNDGNNLLNGGGGADDMAGGAGNDRYVVDAEGDKVTEDMFNGTDRVDSRISYTLGENVENLYLTGSASISGTGNELANEIHGNDAGNRIDGGAGADAMFGGLGSDRYIVDHEGDEVTEAFDEGTDTVESSISYSLAGQHIEMLTLTGTADLNGAGNGLANTLSGNDGANALDGMNGDDKLNGGAGNDSLSGGDGLDKFLFDSALGANNVDQILDFAAADDSIYLKRSVFAGANLGALSDSAFHAGTAAADASDRIVYDQATGHIFYDADGSGAGAQILFATVGADTILTAADFIGY